MRPPHWLDSVIGDLREVDDIALAIAESQKLRQAIQQGVDAAFEWEGLNEHDPKRLWQQFRPGNPRCDCRSDQEGALSRRRPIDRFRIQLRGFFTRSTARSRS